MQAQARICPICYDDHWEGGKCDTGDLISAIAHRDVKIAEAETTIGALKHLVGEQTDRIAELEGEITELRADLEWSTRKCAVYSQGRLRWTRDIDGIQCDGTPDDMRRVIRQARKGE